jgi:opacity protein-like surface antigen
MRRVRGGQFDRRWRGSRWTLWLRTLTFIAMIFAMMHTTAAAEMPPSTKTSVTQVAAAANTAARAEPWTDISAQPQLYVTGMVGSSLGGDPGVAAGSIPVRGLLSGGMPTGEGALGVAIPRPGGALRLEFEARGGDEWSTMGNIWRDISVTERFGTYLGGGVGAAGGTGTVPSATSEDAASQVRAGLDGHIGAGMTYAVNERVTFDVGYRFHAGRVAAAQDAMPDGRLSAGAAALAGSEVLFSVRLYDPFRGWLK